MSRLTIFATAKYGTIPLATLRTARTVEAIKPARCGLINAIKLNGFFCFCMVSLPEVSEILTKCQRKKPMTRRIILHIIGSASWRLALTI